MDQIRILESQFLCCYPVNRIDWQVFKDLKWEQQPTILNHTVLHPLNKVKPIKKTYQYAFLKNLVQTLEKNGSEINDAVYEQLATLCTADASPSNYTFKHYSLPSRNQVLTLKESKTFISEGTTGLCSWQASLALSEWLLNTPEHIADKRVLELGAGTGLAGIVAAKCCKAKSVILSDGSPAVINLLEENLDLNFTSRRSEIKTRLLRWEEELELDIGDWPEVLLGADITFDSSVFPALVSVLDKIFEATGGSCVLYLAATIRNEGTFEEFMKLLGGKAFNCSEENYVSPSTDLFWDESTPIKIFSVRR